MNMHEQPILNLLSNAKDEAQVMLLTFQQHPDMRLYRPVIYIGEIEQEEAGELVLGKWTHSMRLANKAGLKLYFETYKSRHGFKHPQDPTRQPDEELGGSVVTQRGSSGRIETFTNSAPV